MTVITDSFTGRLEWALERAGLSRRQLEVKAKVVKGRLAFPIQQEIELELLVRIAKIVQFDARWLALGIVSPAGEAAARVADAEMRKKARIKPEDRQAIVELLSRMEEPSHAAGVCRYCGCTQEHGCGDCYWVDSAATICSACLQEQP